MSESNSQRQRKWEREEVVILVNEYFRTKDMTRLERECSFRRISEFLRKREELLVGSLTSETFRNYAGVCLQSARVKSLDPETKCSGMKGTKMQQEIVWEYLNNPKKICEEAERIYKKYEGKESSL